MRAGTRREGSGAHAGDGRRSRSTASRSRCAWARPLLTVAFVAASGLAVFVAVPYALLWTLFWVASGSWDVEGVEWPEALAAGQGLAARPARAGSRRRRARQATACASRKARFQAGASSATRATPLRPRSLQSTPSAAAPWGLRREDTRDLKRQQRRGCEAGNARVRDRALHRCRVPRGAQGARRPRLERLREGLGQPVAGARSAPSPRQRVAADRLIALEHRSTGADAILSVRSPPAANAMVSRCVRP